VTARADYNEVGKLSTLSSPHISFIFDRYPKLFQQVTRDLASFHFSPRSAAAGKHFVDDARRERLYSVQHYPSVVLDDAAPQVLPGAPFSATLNQIS
jgi:hypothetical protein